jgi:uncharacterized protein (TIGR02301 family)
MLHRLRGAIMIRPLTDGYPMTFWRLAATILFTLAALAAMPAAAQEAAPDPAPTDTAPTDTAPATPNPNEPAYDPQLLRLSEILGSVHYLRRLCGANEGNVWRDEMQALIDAENPDADRRARLIDRFNRGYQGFRSVYRTCTPAATVAIGRYMEEGAKIARDITARYGRS